MTHSVTKKKTECKRRICLRLHRTAALFDVSALFADIFEGVFCVDNGLTELCRLIFGTDRIDFSVQFLAQKIDFAAGRFVVFDFGFERFQMTEQPNNSCRLSVAFFAVFACRF